MAGNKGLDIDRRVGIAMSVLTSGQRGAVGRILQSPQRFAAHVANPANVKAIKGGDPQLYYLRATPSLRLVYEKSESGIRVVDLVDQATLDHFSTKTVKKKAPKGGLKGQTGASKPPGGEGRRTR